MTPTWLILAVLATHFLGDFILQSDWMAQNKSKRWGPLLLHIGVYTMALFWLGPIYAAMNGAAHLVTDYGTSRWTSYLWARKQNHWFFVVIGLDQLAHYTVLVLTLRWSVWMGG